MDIEQSLALQASRGFGPSGTISQERLLMQTAIRSGRSTRSSVVLMALIGLSIIIVALCAMLSIHFIAPMTWALLLALLAQPVHVRLERWLRLKSLTALVTMALMVVALFTAKFKLLG